MKPTQATEVLHKYHSQSWESYNKSFWLIASKSNVGIAIISPLEGDMRIWKTYIRQGEAIWIPNGWSIKVWVEDLAIIA